MIVLLSNIKKSGITILIICTGIIAVSCIYFAYQKIRLSIYQKELEPLMQEVRKIMRRERIAQRGNPLAVYNSEKEDYPNVIDIDADVWISRVIQVKKKKVTIEVRYYINCFDSEGHRISWVSAEHSPDGDLWIVKKSERGEWEVIEVESFP